MKTKDCYVSILGDSYSTFDKFIPTMQKAYYPNPEKVPDLTRVEETWWHQLLASRNMRLIVNDSYSGSTVCKDTRPGQGPESAFIVRMHHTLRNKGDIAVKPDVIFLFGTTNDSWLDRTVGEVMYENRTEEDLHCILPACCEMIEYVCAQNPQALVCVLINEGLKDAIILGLEEAAKHYGALPVVLKNIDKSNGHPTCLGMTQIAQQAGAALDSMK